MEMMFITVLVLNSIWFAKALNVFALRSQTFVKILGSREHRDSPNFAVLAESGKFLGGFNLGWAIGYYNTNSVGTIKVNQMH